MTDNPITEAILAVKSPYPDCIAMHPATVCAWLGEPMMYRRDGVRDAQGNLRFFGILIRESRDVPERTFVFEQYCPACCPPYRDDVMRDYGVMVRDKQYVCVKCDGTHYNETYRGTL